MYLCSQVFSNKGSVSIRWVCQKNLVSQDCEMYQKDLLSQAYKMYHKFRKSRNKEVYLHSQFYQTKIVYQKLLVRHFF